MSHKITEAKGLSTLGILMITLMAGTPASAKENTCANFPSRNFSGLYEQAVLEKWQPILQRQVLQMLEEDIKPNLKPQAQKLLNGTRFAFPLATRDPFDYYYVPSERTVTIPIQSLLFLRNLIAAYIWLGSQKYDNTAYTGFYLSFLKYRAVTSLPGRRYPTPYEGLGIPFSVLDPPSFKSPEDSRGFEKTLQGALLFILAHELTHASGNYGSGSVENEIAADGVATEIVGRNQASPAGVFLFFYFSAFWVPNGADFSNTESYSTWLNSCSTHPVTGERIKREGTRLAEGVHEYYPGLPESDPIIQNVRAISSRLIDWGERLDSFASNQQLRKFAEIAFPADIMANDLFRLSGSWWGLGFEEFLKSSGLENGEYAAGDDPGQPGHKVIMPSRIASMSRWSPGELIPLVIRFSAENRLAEISGFLRQGDTQDQVLRVLADRYGKPVRELRGLGMITYVWDFGGSFLELSPIGFKLFPTPKPA